MPSQTIRQFLARLDQLRISHRSFIEDDTLIIEITSADYTKGEWEDEEFGDSLVEHGQGWQIEVSREFTVDDLLDGVDNGEGFFFQAYLTHHSVIYGWPDDGLIDRDLNLAEIEQLLAVLMAGDFPHEFFDEEGGSL